MKRSRPIRLVALAIAMLLAFAPAASAYTWEKFKEDFKYKPVGFIVAIPAFLITTPFMLVQAALENAEEDESPA